MQASAPITVTVVSSESGTAAADGADAELRMRVNGETPAQMAHARMRKARTPDTTVDEVWPIDDSLKSADSYVKFCTMLYLLPKFLILLIPMLLLALPFAFISRFYAMFLPYGTDHVERKALGFFIYFFSASLSLIPLSFFWAWSRTSDCVFYYIFGLPYLIFSKDGWARRLRSLDAIRPHMNGSLPLILSLHLFLRRILNSFMVIFLHGYNHITLASIHARRWRSCETDDGKIGGLTISIWPQASHPPYGRHGLRSRPHASQRHTRVCSQLYHHDSRGTVAQGLPSSPSSSLPPQLPNPDDDMRIALSV